VRNCLRDPGVKPSIWLRDGYYDYIYYGETVYSGSTVICSYEVAVLLALLLFLVSLRTSAALRTKFDNVLLLLLLRDTLLMFSLEIVSS